MKMFEQNEHLLRNNNAALLIALIIVFTFASSEAQILNNRQSKQNEALRVIHAISKESLGLICVTEPYKELDISINTSRWQNVQSDVLLAIDVASNIGLKNKDIIYSLASSVHMKNRSNDQILVTRVLHVTSQRILSKVVLRRNDFLENNSKSAHSRVVFDEMASLRKEPWFPKLYQNGSYYENASSGWTLPYFSCDHKKWLIAFNAWRRFKDNTTTIISVEIDLVNLEINQCEAKASENSREIDFFHGSHKCPKITTKCIYKRNKSPKSIPISGWTRGNYVCVCKDGYYSSHPKGVNGTLLEVAYEDSLTHNNSDWESKFNCQKCLQGCERCNGPKPCLSAYNWGFRLTLLAITVGCICMTILLAVYTQIYKREKVFSVASPVFLMITLLGCAIMYAELAAIFPILDTPSCVATKWTRHMGFCITYSALLMKTWRVSLTHRMKSAYKLKLTDKQLLQWMIPILLIMAVYLGTWTISDTPHAENITDMEGLKFKQCTYNWWDHSIAIGEILFLLWGVRVCYSVRNAESLYNEARQISFAIYNIGIINLFMVALHVQIVPHTTPDVKFFLGFIRIQLSTTTTIILVFAPKIIRVVRSSMDKCEGRTSTSYMQGLAIVNEEPHDIYRENEELKEEIQKLAGQLEFMKTMQMLVKNRHIQPKSSGIFSTSAIARRMSQMLQPNCGPP